MTAAVMEILGVLLLAALGVLTGRLAARARRPIWVATYLAPLLLLAMIIAARWWGDLEFVVPFAWGMADRREYALLAFICTCLLTTPVMRLPPGRQRVLPFVLMCVVVLLWSIPPFLLPALNAPALRALKTTIDRDGVCLQGTSYTCGPAAAVTALRVLGVRAEEGELAVLAHTTYAAGTPADALGAAIANSYGKDGIRWKFRSFKDAGEMRGREPIIAVVPFGFLVDHYVTVLAVTDDTVVLGDPLTGRRVQQRAEFEDSWRHCGLQLWRER